MTVFNWSLPHRDDPATWPSEKEEKPDISFVECLLRLHNCITRPQMTVGECVNASLCRCSCGLVLEKEEKNETQI